MTNEKDTKPTTTSTPDERKTAHVWLNEKAAYIRGLKAPSEQQRLFLALFEKQKRTAEDERTFKALIRAEKAADQVLKARADVARILNAEKAAERKARDHELYQSAGLMSLAGLLDKRTGKPVVDRGVLTGALAELAGKLNDPAQQAKWKQAGDKLLAK